ncbi:sulfite exporter TauE/SafE family protein [bacterium]|nr:sulfite exporter TauE/SafE family protein [bacterium]
MSPIYLYLILGLFAGSLSGLLGIGGGSIMIPVLVYLFGLTQHQAQGTTLALMVPPIGLLAALHYYRNGNVNLCMTFYICIGFFVGGLIGAVLAHSIPDLILKRMFGFFLFLISIKMIIGH